LSGNFLQTILGQNAKGSDCVFSIENGQNELRKKYRKMVVDNNNKRSTIAHFQIENLRLYRSYKKLDDSIL
jgi:hypothetical protein